MFRFRARMSKLSEFQQIFNNFTILDYRSKYFRVKKLEHQIEIRIAICLMKRLTAYFGMLAYNSVIQ